ncbi:MAG: 4-hydroxythreonine-4-phosphate dehydrogenase PdxA [Candidatus Gastranaerophilales bacterium]|nr:4-hydroxythreonine-4-phosphate dehydrogenase PdxA [Candidatus Gastranaerophilales bacterium]
MKNKIAITTGDTLGIGEEVTIKALNALKPDKSQILIIGKDLGLGYETYELDSYDNGAYCYKSLEYASKLAREGLINGLVTAPVSKEALHKSGYFFSGQTEILEKLLSQNKNQKAEMLFIARDLRVMLLTRHIPLKNIILSEDIIIEKIERLNFFLKTKCNISSPKIAVCGLNPHAGENGILGSEEKEIILPAIKKLNKKGFLVYGAFSADALFAKAGKKFLNNEKQEFDAIAACYHDQALCPVKTLCPDEAVNTTIGLKIIRTSPPFGTAYDIKGKNLANPKGMICAIELMLKLSQISSVI